MRQNTQYASLHPDCPDLRKLGPTLGDAILRAEAEAVQAEGAAERDRFVNLAREEENAEDGKGVTRRRFFVGSAATVTALATTQWISTQASFAATPTGTLIHVFLYGGMDGLSLVSPANDPVLNSMRGALTIPTGTGASIPLDRGFALSNAFMPLKPYLDKGQLGFVPGVSDERLGRSHFESTDICQLGGLPSQTGGRGFLDTLVGKLGEGTAFRSVGVGSTLPRSLVGVNNALALNNIGSLNVNGDGKYRDATVAAIRGLFTGITHPVESSVKAGLDAMAVAAKIAQQDYKPAAGIKYEGVGNAFRELAQLIKYGANVRVATIGMGGWDTHENQGPNGGAGGYLFRHLGELADAMRAFFDDLADKAADVTIMVSTEFGRRVGQNGSGTDHGHGSVVTLLSGRKLAGSLLGAWGGLTKLDNGDVPEFNNLFNVFGSVAQGRFGLSTAEVQQIFPKHTYTPMNIYA